MAYADTHLVTIPNFTLGSSNFRKNRRGGSCILVRNTHSFKPIEGLKRYCSESIIECSGIELLHHNIIVFCIYRPPKSKHEAIETFFTSFNSLLNKYCCSKKKIIICGDFNINILNKNNLTKTFLETVTCYNLKLSIKEPTRLMSGTCIDNIITNIRGCKGKVLELALSDHTAQILSCPVQKSSPSKHWYIERRDYSQENIDKFIYYINSLTFSEVFETHDTNEAFDLFFDLFSLFYYLCFPVILTKITSHCRPKWISNGLKKCCMRKRQLLWRYRLNRTKENKKSFKSLSGRLKHIINSTKKAQNNHFIQTAHNKCKATWTVIKKSTVNVPKSEIQKISIDAKNYIDNPVTIANLFNDFFIDGLKEDTINNDANLQIPRNPNSMFMSPTSPSEIQRIINNMKNTSSTGYDQISTQILKLVSLKISNILCHIINLAIFNGVFPDKLKTTLIKPLFKKDNKLSMSCYRPIALVPVLSKVFEKVIHNKLYNFFESQHLLTDEQTGFRKNKTINTAVYNFLQKVMINIDNKTPVCALYMDFSKAFDCVNHKILLQKLAMYGVRGNVLKLIESYLSNRKQFTQITRICPKINKEVNFTSEKRYVNLGVPQGSVLGPLLFIIYINDLPKIIKQPTFLFADDCTIVFNDKDRMTLEQDINEAIEKIIEWTTSNNLKLNFDKTNLMIFRNRVAQFSDINIKYSNKKVSHVDTTKFLGLNIDCSLNWKTHIENLCLKINQQSYALHMLSKMADISTVLSAYHGYVGSIIRYGIMFWGHSVHKDDAFKAQKRCVRSICKLKQTDSCKEYFKNLKLLTLPCIYIYEIINFVRSNATFFENYKSKRHNSKICCPNNKTTLLNNSIFCMAPRVYNHLPKYLMEASSSNMFKKKLKSFLINKTYYSVSEYLQDKL